MQGTGIDRMMQGELLTEKGLRHFNYGFLIAMTAYGIIGILFLALLAVWPNIEDDANDFMNPFGFFAPIAWFFIGVVAAIFVILVSLVFFLIGLLSLNSGKWEFGMRHSASMQKGMMFIIIGFVISLFGGFGFGLFGSFVGIVTSILISMGLIYLVTEIADEPARRLLLYGSILFVSINVISAIVSIVVLFTLIGFTEQGFNDIWLITVLPLGLGSLNVFPLAMFYISYKRIYNRVNKREIKPVPPPPLYPYPMAYPPYYPQYPPQYQQPYQYPQQPPPQYSPPNIGIKVMPYQNAPAQGSQGYVRCGSCGASIPQGVHVCPVCYAEQK